MGKPQNIVRQQDIPAHDTGKQQNGRFEITIQSGRFLFLRVQNRVPKQKRHPQKSENADTVWSG